MSNGALRKKAVVVRRIRRALVTRCSNNLDDRKLNLTVRRERRPC
jgi:hypothetical protein